MTLNVMSFFTKVIWQGVSFSKRALNRKSGNLALFFGFFLILPLMSNCTCEGPSGPKSSTESSSPPAPGNTPSTSEQKISIGSAIYKYDDTFMAAVRQSMTETAAKFPKVNLQFVDSAGQQPTQNEKIDLFIAKKVQALAINPVDRTAASVLIDRAREANIPVVFFNREPLAEDMKKWDKVYYVGTPAEQAGQLVGEIVAQYWKTHPEADRNKDGLLQYVMIKGEPGHQDAELRTQYSVESIEKAGIKTEKLAEDTGLWDRVKGQEKMAAMAAAHGPKIEVVIANNDDMALGAIEALKAAGFFGGGTYMPVVGVDATAPALRAIEEGTLLGTVLNDAQKQGEATVTLAMVLAQGQTPTQENTGFEITKDRYVWIPYKKITKTQTGLAP
jgi:methyl-galactoside transport system substrate-binding protein